MLRPVYLGLLALSVALAACVPNPAAEAPASSRAPSGAPTQAAAAQNQAAPAAAAPTQAAAAPPPAQAPAAPAPTQAPVAVVPTQAPLAEPKVAAAQPRGVLTWRDDTLRNDAVTVSAEDLPVLSGGQSYGAWLLGKDANLFIGTLAPGAGGSQALTFAAPDQANLLAGFDRLAIGRAPGGTSTTSSQPSEAILAGSLPEKALVHVRHVLVGIAVTPDGIGFGLGLRKETDELLRHAQFLNEAMQDNNLPLEKLHAEHMINLIEGQQGEHYGDLNGNGRIDNPGDGYGVLQNGTQDGYIKGMRDHAQLAATSPDATDEIKLHAGHVQIAGDNTQARTSELRDRALEILKMRSVAETRTDVQKIVALAQQTIQGVDLNGDEQVAPVKGEGGVMVGYQHAQLMAVMSLTRPTAAVALPTTAAAGAAAAPTQAAAAAQPTPTAHAHTAAPTAAPVAAAPTTAPAAAAPTVAAKPAAPAKPATQEISIGDNTFTPKSLTIARGTVVVWSQDGQRPHTVTADDGSFDSQVIRSGATFTRTFTEPGTFLYYCDLHGGAGGVGMAAQVIVQ